MGGSIRHFRELEVYQLAMGAAMELFELTKGFPVEERYSLTDQVRRSSRSVCANLAEAWRKRRYLKAFVSKLSDAEAEAAETQVWIEFSTKCRYLAPNASAALDRQYEIIQGKVVNMLTHPEQWRIRQCTVAPHRIIRSASPHRTRPRVFASPRLRVPVSPHPASPRPRIR